MRFPTSLRAIWSARKGPRLFPSGDSRVRQWLVAGLLGALVVAALVPMWDVWQVNAAGILVNRAVAGPASLSASDRKAALEQAMTLMEKAAARGPFNAAHEIPIWRTYGAAASHDPSEHAYTLLYRSLNAGRVDRVGELWLGEVAAALGKIDEAQAVYERIDVSNLLIDRAEASLQAGKDALAIQWYGLAYASLNAAIQRDREEALQLDRAGSSPSAMATLMNQSGEKVTSLFRIGRGYLKVGQSVEAVKVLEQAQSEAKIQSPGAVAEQSLMLALAQGLADTRPQQPGTAAGSLSLFAMDPKTKDYVLALIRVRVLVVQAVALGKTAPAYVQAGRILVEIGDTNDGLADLNTAIRLDARNAEAYLTLSTEYENLTMLDQARIVLTKGVKELPGNVELAVALAGVVYKTAAPNDALPVLIHAAAMKTRDPYLFANLGDCYLALGQLDKAREAYLEGLARSPGAKSLVSRLAALPPAGAP
jgi:tetratricopeptide (TPR) repeat protein